MTRFRFARAPAMAVAVGVALSLRGAPGTPAFAASASEHGQWKAPAQVPVRLVAHFEARGCGGDSIPQVTMEGGLELGALGARLAFRKGAGHVADGSVDLVPADFTIPLERRTVSANEPGAGFYFVQLMDAAGRPLSDPVLAGRCVDGVATRAVAALMPVEVNARVETAGCGDRQGPRAALDGAVELSGLTARITFRATDDPLVGPPLAAAIGVSRDVPLLAPGRSVPIVGAPVFAGALRNPSLYGQLTLGSGVATGPEVFLGKCSQLKP